MDNQRLEKYVNDWKVMAEKSESNVSRYYREMSKIFSVIEEAKLELSCIYNEYLTQ